MKKKTVLILCLVLVTLLSGVFYFLLNKQEKEAIKEKEVLVALQKEAMQEQLANLSDEYENQFNKLTINGREGPRYVNGDSLITQIEKERAKVNNLLDQLKQVKASNTQQISKLSREISTLRKVLKSYVIQIDSLYAKNKRLEAENIAVKKNLRQVKKETELLTKETESLKSIVSLASKLDILKLIVLPLDSRGRQTDRISKIKQIQIAFLIGKNSTTSVGIKNFYIRIMTPKDEVLRTPNSGTFLFEDKKIPYSIQRTVEYNGEQMPLSMFWDVDESLEKGIYRVQVFEAGNMIASSDFEL